LLPWPAMMIKNETWVGSRWWVALALASTAALAGCGAPEDDLPGTPGVPSQETAGIEVRRDALTAFHRSYPQASLLPNGKVVLAWTDNRDPATGQPGAIFRPWVSNIDPSNGGVVVAPTTYNTRPSYDSGTKDVGFARIAVGNNQLLLAYSWAYSSTDHDVLGLMLDPNTLVARSTVPINIETTGSDDIGAYPAYSPFTNSYLVTFDQNLFNPPRYAERANYVYPSGTTGSTFVINPIPNSNGNVAGQGEGDAVYADGRFLSSVDDAVSSIIPGQFAVAGSTADGGSHVAHQRVTPSGATRTVAVVALGMNVNGGNGTTVYLRSYSTAACYANPACALAASPLYTVGTIGAIPGVATGTMGNGYVVVVSPNNGVFKTIVTNQFGDIMSTATVTPACSVQDTGLVIETPSGTWSMWLGCNYQLRGLKLDSLGRAATAEQLIIN
jgi:hypothetical protein